LKYKGKYRLFDVSKIKTYPVSTRKNKVNLESLADPKKVLSSDYHVDARTEEKIAEIAGLILDCAGRKKPVVLFTGAHLIKNGFGPLIVDLMKKKLVTLVAGNGAVSIHDFELSFIGETSESVPNALPLGKFGMAYEFSYINDAVTAGSRAGLGYGEALGKAITEDHERFKHPEVSILASGYRLGIPVTIHISIGTDVNNQHPNFDGGTAGAASRRDFLIYVNEITKLTDGGMVLNVGSAVSGPEVLLKAVSMSASAGFVPGKFITADFDIRPCDEGEMANENSHYYYFRDQKSVVTRIPQSFGGRGIYVQGNLKSTIPLLYKKLTEKGQ
jgi:hypothetical protein